MGSPCIELIRDGAGALLRVNFAASAGTIANARTFVFGLQATPVRPTPVAPAHQMVMNYFGFDNPIVRAYAMGLVSKDLHLARQILEPRKGRGETAHVYMANDIMPVADPVADSDDAPFDAYEKPVERLDPGGHGAQGDRSHDSEEWQRSARLFFERTEKLQGFGPRAIGCG